MNMHYKSIILTLTLYICAQLHAAERAPQPPSSQKLSTFGQMIQQAEQQHAMSKRAQEIADLRKRLPTLPADIQKETILYVIRAPYPNLYEVAARISALHDKIDTPLLLKFLKPLPYTANAIDLIERLEKNPLTASLVKNNQIQTFLADAKKRLEDGEKFNKIVRFETMDKIQEFLKNKNLNINTHSNLLSITPLMQGAMFGLLPVLQLLLQAGANPDIQDETGRTALMHAVDREAKGENVIDKIIRAKLQIKSKKTEEFAPLTSLLLNAGADPDIADIKGKRARDIALEHGNIKIVELLDAASAKRKQ